MYICKFRITKLTSRILLLIFLYNTIGYFFIIKCVQTVIKRQAAQHIQFQSPDNPLKAIAFHKDELKKIHWEEEEEEMRYNGKLYDVAKTTETTDSIIYHCINDEHEDRLYDQLDDHITNHVTAPPRTHSSKKTPLKPVKLYFSNEVLFSFDLYPTPFLQPDSFSNSYLPVYIEMSAPPPRLT